MNLIAIDRELLHSVLARLFQLEAENRAYFGMFRKSSLKAPASVTQGYFDLHESETKKELAQTEGFRIALLGRLQTQDDGAFLEQLDKYIPRRSSP